MVDCLENCIEGYTIHEQIGKGGFASVYLATCKRNGLQVAIKMIDKQLMQAAGMSARVRQEVQIHSTLKHASILLLHTFFEDDDSVYLVLELCRNGELARHVRRHGTLPEVEARQYMRQIVEGMLYLNSKRILHRDLSLSNLLLDDQGQVKIADFGLATQLQSAEDRHRTMCGTPNYISPEVATRSWHGLEADVWALGCMLYTMLVGRPPFDTDGVRSTLTKVVMSDVQYPDGMSGDAVDLIRSLLEKNQRDRIALTAVLRHPFMTGVTAAVSSGVYGSGGGAGGWSAVDSGLGTINTMATGSSAPQRSRSRETAAAASSGSASGRVAGRSRAAGRRVCSLDRGGQRQAAVADGAGCDTSATSQQHGMAQFRRRFTAPQQPLPSRPVLSSVARSVVSAPSACGGSTSAQTPSSQHYSHQLHQQPQQRQRSVSPAASSWQFGGGVGCSGGAGGSGVSQGDPTCSGEMRRRSLDRSGSRHRNPSPTNVLHGLQPPVAPALQAGPAATGAGSTPPVSPLSTRRLKPTRQRSRNAAFTLDQRGEVCLEFVRRRHGRQLVVDVCRISADGHRIVTYRPDGGECAVGSEPPPLPAGGADAFYSYQTLPEKHWKKYIYAARFVKLVKGKTPKLTLYTDRAKCILMENGPAADLEMCFYHGGSVTRVGGKVMLTVQDSAGVDAGAAVSPDTSGDVQHFSAAERALWQHYLQAVQQCEMVEAALSSLETSGAGGSYFPVIVGRRPSSTGGQDSNPRPHRPLAALTGAIDNKENMTPGSRPAVGVGQSLPQVNPARKHGRPRSSASALPPPRNSANSQSVATGAGSWEGSLLSTRSSLRTTDHDRRVRIPHIGLAAQLADGTIEVECEEDGSRLRIDPRSSRLETWDAADIDGTTGAAVIGGGRVYTRRDVLPARLKRVMEQLPRIVQTIVSTAT